MNSLTIQEARRWCENANVPINEFGRPDSSSLRHRFELPDSAEERAGLASRHLDLLVGKHRSLVWITEWNVWPSLSGMGKFRAIRNALGETRELIDIPAFLFSESEEHAIRAMVDIAVRHLWEVHIITKSAKHWAFFSHDEHGASSTRVPLTNNNILNGVV